MKNSVWYAMIAMGILLILFGPSTLEESTSFNIFNVFADAPAASSESADNAKWVRAGIWP